MPSYIHHIETAVPEFAYRQDDLRQKLQKIVGGTKKENRIIQTLFSRSGIETRYSVVDDFKEQGNHTLFFNGRGAAPGTQSRNETYIREGRKLFVKTAQKLLRNSGIQAKEITHLITVSCTGFYAPGPDVDIINKAGLHPGIERYHLGFMGCYAALPALKLADKICRASSRARVMIVCTELCSIHFQANPKLDNLLSATVFADGSSGAILSSQKPNSEAYMVDGFASTVANKGSEDMAWSIGDTGFNMVLSNYIPDLLAGELHNFLDPVLSRFNLTLSDVDEWAVHPGGRAILDKIESTLPLPEHALQPSRTVLSNYGNMSSATLFFVLKEWLHQPAKKKKNRTLAMAFGPGLTLESALLTRFQGL